MNHRPPPPGRASQEHPRCRLSIAGTLMLLAIVGGCGRSDGPAPTPTAPPAAAAKRSSLDTAKAAFGRGNLRSAQAAIGEHLLVEPDDPIGLELAGDIAAAMNDSSMATELYRSAVTNSSPASVSLYEKLARQWMNAGAPFAAADVLRESVGDHPENPKVRADLAGLVASLGMTRDAAEHLRWLLRRGQGGLNELIVLANLNIPQTDAQTCQYALKYKPNDLRPKFALAVVDAYEGDFEAVAAKLAEVTDKHPKFPAAWALYGRALVELGDDKQLRLWQQQLPKGTDSWAEYWIAAGLWAERNQQPKLAASAFWKAVQIDDCHGEALTHLAGNLVQLGMKDQAKRVAQRAADVNAMHDSVESLLSWRRNSQQAAIGVAEAMSQLGRPWEAEAWARAATVMTQEVNPQTQQIHRGFYAKLKSNTPWQLPEVSLASLDLSDLGDFAWQAQTASVAKSDSPQNRTSSAIRFADEARQRGLQHTCAINKSEPEASIWIYQSNAGGAGVIDYDLDGNPDLYLTVIDGQPLADDSSPNRLFRNIDGQFVDQTTETFTGERGFSQGVAVGDYDADGFPDLWVANIGANRLFRNNGDGTFRDVTAETGLGGQRWTTSLAIADIDGDGTADLVEVNYAAGEQPYSQACIDAEVEQPRSCSPLVFAAEGDRVWRGVGDGTFVDATTQWLTDQSPGHGLGLVVGQIDESPGNDIYVANDMTANHFWSSAGSEQGFQLKEQAAVRGLAVDSRSRSQASMGIALGDGDQDGDLDIFLTHFTNDHNTLYEQLQPGTWFDRTSAAGLAEPSNAMLAFGTEWIDADNSGSLELLVANGNVDDFSHQGYPLRMPAQLFAQRGDGRWQQYDRQQLGPYFEQARIGRALVTLDVNRDGLQDAVITHIYDPVSLLVNQTDTDARSIRMTLKGRASGRDAVGAIVRAKVAGQQRIAPLTAGDGFQCSNERCLLIGLGSADSAQQVTIDWPDGGQQEIGELRAGADYLIVQGETEPFMMGSRE